MSPGGASSSWSPAAALITELGAYGPGGRAHYEGQPGDPDRLRWTGDTP